MLLATSVAGAPALHAQEPAPGPAPTVAGDTAAPAPADPTTSRSPALAGVLEFIVPMAGHFYAGAPRRGLAPLGLVVGGLAVLAWDGSRCDGNLGCSGGAVLTGAGLVVAGRLWGVASAVRAADGRSRRDPQDGRLRMGIAPSGRRGATVAGALRF
jgi:hypothetical protein